MQPKKPYTGRLYLHANIPLFFYGRMGPLNEKHLGYASDTRARDEPAPPRVEALKKGLRVGERRAGRGRTCPEYGLPPFRREFCFRKILSNKFS